MAPDFGGQGDISRATPQSHSHSLSSRRDLRGNGGTGHRISRGADTSGMFALVHIH